MTRPGLKSVVALSVTAVTLAYTNCSKPNAVRFAVGNSSGTSGANPDPTDPTNPADPGATPAATSVYSRWTNGPSTDPSYFPIGVWLQGSQRIQEYKNIGVNTFVGSYDGVTQNDLSLFAAAGIPLVADQNSISLTSPQRTAMSAWAQMDEPDNAQANGNGGYDPCIPTTTLVARYNAMKANDATRPVFLNFGRGVSDINWVGRGTCTGDTDYYVRGSAAADIISYDIYPVSSAGGKLEIIASGIDNLKTWSGGQKIIWNAIEASALDGGAVPTGAQVKALVWMSLIHGSRGIFYFVHEFSPSFREDGLFNHPELVQAVTAINAEIKSLAPVLNSATVTGKTQVSVSPTTVPVDTMTKVYGDSTYVFAAAMRGTPVNATFTLSPALNGQVEVIGENRGLTLSNGRFQDGFAGYGVHLYRIRSN